MLDPEWIHIGRLYKFQSSQVVTNLLTIIYSEIIFLVTIVFGYTWYFSPPIIQGRGLQSYLTPKM